MGQGEGNREQPTIRGNSTTADFFVDGVRDDAQYFRDSYNIERVEARPISDWMQSVSTESTRTRTCFGTTYGEKGQGINPTISLVPSSETTKLTLGYENFIDYRAARLRARRHWTANREVAGNRWVRPTTRAHNQCYDSCVPRRDSPFRAWNDALALEQIRHCIATESRAWGDSSDGYVLRDK